MTAIRMDAPENRGKNAAVADLFRVNSAAPPLHCRTRTGDMVYLALIPWTVACVKGAAGAGSDRACTPRRSGAGGARALKPWQGIDDEKRSGDRRRRLYRQPRLQGAREGRVYARRLRQSDLRPPRGGALGPVRRGRSRRRGDAPGGAEEA